MKASTRVDQPELLKWAEVRITAGKDLNTLGKYSSLIDTSIRWNVGANKRSSINVVNDGEFQVSYGLRKGPYLD